MTSGSGNLLNIYMFNDLLTNTKNTIKLQRWCYVNHLLFLFSGEKTENAETVSETEQLIDYLRV